MVKVSRASSFGFNKVGLWSVWLSGFLLIALSLHATQLLPSLKDQIKPKTTQQGFADSRPSITIFSAPSPFAGLVGARQSLAIRSWLALSGNISVVLFGQHPSVVSSAKALGHRVAVESQIDFTFLGIPFFHAMVARSRSSSSDISVLIDPETIVLPDFISTLNYAHKLDHDWLLFAMSPDISHFPFNLDGTGKHWFQDGGEEIKLVKLQEFLVQKRRWSNCGDRVLWAWNTGELPLHAGVLPPFLYGRGLCNQWLMTEALSSDFRFVFDATEAMSSFYPKNMGHWLDRFSVSSEAGGDVSEKNWESEGNSHLAALYGSFYFRQVNFSNNPVKLLKCAGRYLFVSTLEESFSPHKGPELLATHTLQPALYHEKGRSGLWKEMILRSGRVNKREACLEYSSLVRKEMGSYNTESTRVTFATLTLPFSLERLLQTVADREKSIVLAIAGNNYRDFLMSWACRLRHLAISNFIVCALDPEVYRFSILQGLPVFKDPLAPTNISFDDCHFGTKCFQRVTKVKSRIVLQILKLGYDVLLSDVDVYWFENPLPYLRSFGPAILVAQSDEYNETGPINLPRRLNSGFYYAHSDPATISAMAMVVKHASTSGLSEQPSFYDILCGEGGINRISDSVCLEPKTNLTIQFLDRDLFPNGAFRGLWEKDNVREACRKKGCMALHNNWISGRKKKLQRQISSGLWEYDTSTRMCRQSWQDAKSASSF